MPAATTVLSRPERPPRHGRGDRHRTQEVFAHGDVAHSIGDDEETLVFSAGAEPVRLHNNYFARWERAADGNWRLDRLVVGPVAASEGMQE